MSLRIVLFGILLCVYSCQGTKDSYTHEQMIERFISALNEGNFNQISSFLSDSLRTEEAEFLLTDNLAEYYTWFQWDSVFNPHYEIVDIQDLGEYMQVTLSKECNRIRYLLDTALITKTRIEFHEDKIARMLTWDFLNMDFQKWEARRDTLVAWIGINHPDLNGFTITQTIEGGQNYLEAIYLYTHRTKP